MLYRLSERRKNKDTKPQTNHNHRERERLTCRGHTDGPAKGLAAKIVVRGRDADVLGLGDVLSTRSGIKQPFFREIFAFPLVLFYFGLKFDSLVTICALQFVGFSLPNFICRAGLQFMHGVNRGFKIDGFGQIAFVSEGC